jgi:polar amino acid transport system permease protein
MRRAVERCGASIMSQPSTSLRVVRNRDALVEPSRPSRETGPDAPSGRDLPHHPPRSSKLGKSQLWQSAQFLAFVAVVVWLTLRGADAMGYNWQWYRVPQYFYRVIDGELIWGPLVRGAIETLKISGWSLVLTLALGLLTAVLRLSDSISGRILARGYMEAIRNTPLLVQLNLFYFVIGPIFGIDRFWTGVLCLAVFEGAFAPEIFRAGILAVPRGQWEASSGLGLSRLDTYRYVVLPQAVITMLPPLASLAISLVKHSAIVSVIALFELTTAGRDIISQTFMSFEIWFTVAAIYLVITLILSAFVSYLERRFRRHG